MSLWIKLSIVSLIMALLSSCAPALMPVEKFPIKPGDTWTLNYAQTPNVERDFRLWGGPMRDSEYVGYSGTSDSDDVLAFITNYDMLVVLVFLDDEPKDQQKILHCFLENDNGNWSGHGFIGTNKQFESLSRTQLFKQPSCEIKPKKLQQSHS